MLKIKNLHAEINGKKILKNFNLEINSGEVHAIMGPNGSGKSTLANILAGKEDYEISEGEILYKNKNLFDMSAEERANEGIFLSFQYPVEIPGVSMINFLKTAINSQRKYKGEKEMSSAEFLKYMRETKNVVEIKSDLTNRSVNEGFSGGEKKRNEIFQMAMLKPTLSILDETDSGLDIDALKIVANGVNKLKSPDTATIVITHYQRLLDFIVPDKVHVLYDGKIVKSGNKDLALELEKQGYNWIKEKNA